MNMYHVGCFRLLNTAILFGWGEFWYLGSCARPADLRVAVHLPWHHVFGVMVYHHL